MRVIVLKKFLKTLIAVFVLISCVGLCACDQSEMPENPLVTKVTDFSAWEYYYQVDTLQNDIYQNAVRLAQSSDKAKTDVQKYLSIVSNNQNITNVIRDCAATIDCFDKHESSAIFDFDDMPNYKVELVKSNTYRVTYDHLFKRCIVKDANSEVDNLVFEIPIFTTVDITLEKGENNIYAISSIAKNCVLSPYASAFENTQQVDGKTVTTKRQVDIVSVTSPKEYTKVTITASQERKSASGQVEYRYERETKYYLKSGHFYLQDTVKIDGNTTLQQNLRMDNSFSNTSIAYNPLIGYFAYDIRCHLDGELQATGEIYFQGNNNYFSKQIVSVTTSSDGKPLGVGQSYTLESRLQSAKPSQKLMFGKVSETKLSAQNMNTFGLHTVNDGQSAVFGYDSDNLAVLDFYG